MTQRIFLLLQLINCQIQLKEKIIRKLQLQWEEVEKRNTEKKQNTSVEKSTVVENQRVNTKRTEKRELRGEDKSKIL